MKKILFVAPLMAISLIGCNKGGGDKPEQVEFMLSTDQPTQVEGKAATVYIDWKQNDHIIKFSSFTFTADPVKDNEISFEQTGNLRPMPVTITFDANIIEDINGTLSFTYEDTTAKTTGNSSISITIHKSKWYEYKDWWNYCSNGVEDVQATDKDVSKEVELTVNNKIHKVRLIDVDKDIDKNGNTIHCTFEFATLLSDDKGYSLATQWNDTNNTATSSGDYLSSTIRIALNGNEDKTENVLWAQKEETEWSDEYTHSALSMLPEELVKVLKAPKKYVACIDNNNWVDKVIENDKGEYDKLFLLSPREMGCNDEKQESSEHTFPYAFYKNAVELTDTIRVKRQINETDIKHEPLPYIQSERQSYEGDVWNCAGYNSDIGSKYWLRSPYQSTRGYKFWSWYVNEDLLNGDISYNDAYAVAPAFCI